VKENGWQGRVIWETCVTVFLVKEEIHTHLMFMHDFIMHT